MERSKVRNEQSYLSFINSFFIREKFSSTYKPFLLKSLIDLSEYTHQSPTIAGYRWIEKDGDTLKVDLNFVAIRFIKLYWDLYFKFKLKQSSTPRDVNINRTLLGLRKDFERKTPTLDTLESDRYATERKDVIQQSLKPEVLPRLDPDEDLYEIVSGTSTHITVSEWMIKREYERVRLILT